MITLVEAIYMGRQFTQVMADLGQNTDGRVILYDSFPRFFARAWDDGGDGSDIWFWLELMQRTGVTPPYTYTILPAFTVNSRDNSEHFYDKQYYKSGEECIVNYGIEKKAMHDLSLVGGSNIFAIRWTAVNRVTGLSLATRIIEFTYIPESRLLTLEKIDFVSFDRLTIYRPDNHDPVRWDEVEAPLIPLSASLDEPFESGPKTLSITMPDPDGLFLPQSQDSINYIGTHATGVYSPVFVLGNKVAYEHTLAHGTTAIGWTNLHTYADPSRYRGRVWFLEPPHQKTPWMIQDMHVRRSFDFGVTWEDVQPGDEFVFFQCGAFFRDDQLGLGVTNIEARGQRYNCIWDFAGIFYMGAPTYMNSPDTGTILKVDCQDRLSKLDRNGRVFISTCEVARFAELQEDAGVTDQHIPGIPPPPPYEPYSNIVPSLPNSGCLKTWYDPALPGGPAASSALLLWFYDDTGPYNGNYLDALGVGPIEDGSARVWNDEFEITVEYASDFTPPDPADWIWMPVDEDAYERTIYGILFDRDWSGIYPLAERMPWTYHPIRIIFQTFVPDTNPVNLILQEMLEYPNYEEATVGVPGRYGGPALSPADYYVPGLSGSLTSDDWMELDVNKFIWTHFNGSVLEGIKELMRIAGFPFNYRFTAEPNPAWTDTPVPWQNPPEDIITFREVSQYPMDAVEMMLMLPVSVQEKIEEDRTATMVRTRVFDDFSPNFAHEKRTITRILWGPHYEGGFNECPSGVWLRILRERYQLKDIGLTWHPGQIDNQAHGVVTDSDYLTHVNWEDSGAADKPLCGLWHRFIASPILELDFQAAYCPFNLAALDLRNSNQWDIASASDWPSHQHIGIKYGYKDDLTVVGGLSVLGPIAPNDLGGPGLAAYETDELIGATLEIISTGAVGNPDIGNTYPIIANDKVAQTVTVEIRDSDMVPGSLLTQLVGAIPGAINVYIKQFKWLPNFNRIIHPCQNTIEWELDRYILKDIRYLEIWLIRPAAANIQGGVGLDNDMWCDIGGIFIYDEGVTIGKPTLCRIRDDLLEVPNESEDFDFGLGAFYRLDYCNRLGIRTNVLPDDKTLNEQSYAFTRCGEALYENLVIEDSYEINGIYYPHIPRYSTVLINVESMRIAFPALLESRSFTFAGTKRDYRFTLRNYNTELPHMQEPESPT